MNKPCADHFGHPFRCKRPEWSRFRYRNLKTVVWIQ